MEQEKIIEALRNGTKENPDWGTVCKLLGDRERNRSSLSLTALRQVAHAVPIASLRNFISLLATLELGKLVTNKTGQPEALINIQTDLRSIGAVGLGKSETLTGTVDKTRVAQISNKRVQRSDRLTPSSCDIKITLGTGRESIQLVVPSNVSPKELSYLIAQLKRSF